MAIRKSLPCILPPGTQANHELQLAYEFFKVHLFNLADWPPCFITLQRRGSCTLGYFSPARFATADDQVADEIALNPRHFKNRSFVDVMSTLVHEMVHAWQHHHGRKWSGSTYHNREWAGEMLRLGLHPSHTGEPGGKMTGQSMSHYIIPGGRFEQSIAQLRRMLPGLTWFDADAAHVLPKGLAGSDLIAPASLSGRRTVYRCPACRQRAESDSKFSAICTRCELQFQREGLR
jgi:SprT-like family